MARGQAEPDAALDMAQGPCAFQSPTRTGSKRSPLSPLEGRTTGRIRLTRFGSTFGAAPLSKPETGRFRIGAASGITTVCQTLVFQNGVLRLVLMLGGLLLAIGAMWPMARFVGGGLATAMFSMPITGLASFVSYVCFVLVYAGGMVYTCWLCFGLINQVPERVIRWIGGSPDVMGDSQTKSVVGVMGSGGQTITASTQLSGHFAGQLGKKGVGKMRGYFNRGGSNNVSVQNANGGGNNNANLPAGGNGQPVNNGGGGNR